MATFYPENVCGNDGEVEEVEEYEEEEEVEERMLRVETKFEALKAVVFGEVKEQKKRTRQLESRLEQIEADVSERKGSLNESLCSLREDIQELKGEEEMGTRKKRKIEVEVEYPTLLEDVEDTELKEALTPHYVENLPASEKLNRVQLAYLHHYFATEKKGQYSASSRVVDQLIQTGVAKTIWPRNFMPRDIKPTTFQKYLKEKIKNIIKKKLMNEASTSFALELNSDLEM